ncbi:hypothetical protein [Hoeflea poritis]|uniref:RiPP n=1 Tax=Hoeflea poritis TaxID=2993659 RepID=A0ABT4VH27_9HYPH|nr:hypothetical protein [Hoeflea poritis]MDA4843995.1 hypothetical protein [Hoeflea poritis]
MKKTYETPIVSKRGRLADRTAELDPKISGITVRIPDLGDEPS